MEVLAEIFLGIVAVIAETIGESMAETVDDNLENSPFAKRLIVYLLIYIVIVAVIVALGFGTVLLFLSKHPIAGVFVAITDFFFIALFISVMVKLNKIRKTKSYKKK